MDDVQIKDEPVDASSSHRPKEERPESEDVNLQLAKARAYELPVIADICTLEDISDVKEEMDIGPIELQPMDIQYHLRQSSGTAQCVEKSHLPAIEPGPSGKLTENTYVKQNLSADSQANENGNTVSINLATSTKSAMKQKFRNAIVFCPPMSSTDEPKYGCDICCQMFTSISLIIQHLKGHFEIKEFFCNICRERFTGNDTLTDHMIQSHVATYEIRVAQKDLDIVDTEQNEKFQQEIPHSTVHMTVYGRSGSPDAFVLKRLCEPSDGTTTDTISYTTTPCLPLLDEPKADVLLHVCNVCRAVFNLPSDLNEHAKSHFEKSEKSRKLPYFKADRKPHYKNYFCSDCHLSYSSKRSLEHHVLMHSQRIVHLCHICGMIFPITVRYHKCINVISDYIPDRQQFYCAICCEAFDSKEVLTDHKSTHFRLNYRPYIHTICTEDLVRKAELTTVVSTTSGRKDDISLKCTICYKEFNDEHQLTKHKLIKHGQSLYFCNFCSKGFNTRNGLVKHITLHSEQRQQYGCDICQQIFLRKIDLINHISLHTTAQNCCRICGMTLMFKHDFERHMSLHTSVANSCDICGKFFKCKHCLERHMLLHTANDYSCPLCGIIIKIVNSLESHMLLHTGKVYCCDICGKVFKFKHSLKQHVLLHAIKTYCCALCGKILRFKHSLERHMLRHTAKAYCCDKCGKIFKFKQSLERHMLCHVPKDSYTCGNILKATYCLKRHMLRHTAKAYCCDTCGKTFKFEKNLKQHFLHHSVNEYLRLYRHKS